jgi:hypothetical protein
MKRIIAALLVVLASAGVAQAEETLRCGSKIVRVGMTSDEVRKYCGAPTTAEVEDHDVRAGTRLVGTTQLHIWTYKRGNSQAAAILEFDEGVLLSIEYDSKK